MTYPFTRQSIKPPTHHTSLPTVPPSQRRTPLHHTPTTANMFPVKGFLYAPTARTHRGKFRSGRLQPLRFIKANLTRWPSEVVSLKPSTSRLGELVQRHARALTVVYMTEPIQAHPDVDQPTWSCVVTINGYVRGSVAGKKSRQESMEAAAKEALGFLSQLGYQ